MKELYEGHYHNAMQGLILAKTAAAEVRRRRREEYDSNPNLCSNCNCALDFSKRKAKYCTLSCRATSVNKKRGSRPLVTKERISKALTGRTLSDEHKRKSTQALDKVRPNHRQNYNDAPKSCSVCGIQLTFEQRHRKTCSRICNTTASTQRTYHNGSRKTIYYKGVVLESSWEHELAVWLDDRSIEWIRPSPIPWFDGQVERLYYPDFFLPGLNLYVDPKNPYCLEKDKVKMEEIAKKVTIVYGNIESIKDYIGRAV